MINFSLFRCLRRRVRSSTNSELDSHCNQPTLRRASRNIAFAACGLFGVASLAGCGHVRFPAAYKLDIAQGNILERDKVDKLQPGMTQRQVVYLLGNPVLNHDIDPNQWHYVYSFSKSGGVPKRYQLTLKFTDEVLTKIDGDQNAIPATTNE